MTTIHASAVLIGRHAALVRGPAGAGKSSLVLAALDAAAIGRIPFARLVADDRAALETMHGRLLVSPAPALAGLIEVRGLGVRTLPYEPVAVVGWVVDLASEDAERMPEATSRVTIGGVVLPRLALPPGAAALPLLLAAAAGNG